jgi:GxxExxY protein
MPIEVESEIHVLDRDEFHSLAHRVLGIAFDVHNEFGRLLDESVYKRAITLRCAAAGILPARQEVRILVRFNGFEKLYCMDLLFASGLMVELKTVESLTNAHFSQAINYLLLTGMAHGLLLNLRAERVTHQFVSTTLDLAERRRFSIHDADWTPTNESSRWLRQTVAGLLADWGAFLQVPLYREAIIHFLGGPERALRKIPILDGEHTLGFDEVCLLCDDTALAFTAVTDAQQRMREHLQRLLDHTRLACIQWINLNRHDIEFRTIVASGDRTKARLGRTIGAE